MTTTIAPGQRMLSTLTDEAIVPVAQGATSAGITAPNLATYVLQNGSEGALGARVDTDTPAAAAAVAAVTMGSANVGIYWGTGDPSSALVAPQGSLFIRTDGSSSSTRMYINTDGDDGWTNVTTAG
jgi:hypothetical protein